MLTPSVLPLLSWRAAQEPFTCEGGKVAREGQTPGSRAAAARLLPGGWPREALPLAADRRTAGGAMTSHAKLAEPIKTVEEKWRLLPSFLRVRALDRLPLAAPVWRTRPSFLPERPCCMPICRESLPS